MPMYRSIVRPLRLFLALVVSVAFLPAVAEELDSLYSIHDGAASMSRKELRIMLEGLLNEEYIDSSECVPTRSLAEQQFSVENGMTYRYFDEHNLDKSLKACVAALEILPSSVDENYLFDLLSQKGICYLRMGKYDESMLAFEDMRLHAEEAGSLWNLSSAYNNLAGVYLSAATANNNYGELAEKYIQKAIETEKQVPGSPGLSIRYGMACEIAVRNDKPEEALVMVNEALALDSIKGDTLKMARRYSQKGDALFALQRYDETEQAYLKAYELLNAVNELTSLSINCRQLGSFYAMRGDREQALEYLMRGYNYSRKAGYRYMTQRIMSELCKFYKGTDDSEALRWMEYATALKDSIIDEQTNDKLREYQVRYESSEQQVLIDRQQQTLKRQHVMQIAMACLVGFILAVGYVLYAFSYARRQNTRRQMAEQEASELRLQLKSRDSMLLSNIAEIIEQHINDSSLSVPSLSEMLAMSQSSLTRQVKLLTGSTVQEYIQKVRMDKAADMLKNSEMSVGEIAVACGYDDASYFSRVFKQRFQQSPSQYRRANPDQTETSGEPDQPVTSDASEDPVTPTPPLA